MESVVAFARMYLSIKKQIQTRDTQFIWPTQSSDKLNIQMSDKGAMFFEKQPKLDL